MRHIEETFNRALGDALRNINPHWDRNSCHVETQHLLADSPQLRPDLLITEATAPPVVIECSYQRNDADNDAQGRIGLEVENSGLPIDAAIALVIPQKFRQMTQTVATNHLCAGEEFEVALFQQHDEHCDRFPERGYIPSCLNSLSDLLGVAAVTRDRALELAKRVAMLVRQAEFHLEHMPQPAQQRISAEIAEHNVLNELQVVGLMWLNALHVQQHLHRAQVDGVEAVPFEFAEQPFGTWFLRQWRHVLSTNWQSIYQPAVASLRHAVNYESELCMAVSLLIRALRRMERMRLGRHINVGAELFPLLSADRKEAAAFYTNAGTAEFLARLTIRDADLTPEEWKECRIYATRRLADLACGTGTLLRAGHTRITGLARRHGGVPDATMHRQAMEQGIIGVDISPIATHLTASSLAMLGECAPYENTQIGWIRVGGAVNGLVQQSTAGSLEYLHEPAQENLFGEGYGAMAGHQDMVRMITIEDQSIDWMLMNPPYSRSRGKQPAFDVAGLTADERHRCLRRWGYLLRNKPANKNAGLAASFLVLAQEKVRPGGRIGFVLPLTAAFSERWTETRVMIAKEFTDITAIAVAGGHKTGSFSADTGMSEMILVATRGPDGAGNQPAPVNCVTLDIAPIRNGIAGELARAINRSMQELQDEDSDFAAGPVMLGSRVGNIQRIVDTGRGDPWLPLGVRSISLCRMASNLVQGQYLDVGLNSTNFCVPITTIDEQFDVGPTHDDIGYVRGGSKRGVFVVDPIVDGQFVGLDRLLWKADFRTQTSLQVTPTHRGTVRRGQNAADTDAVRDTAGTLFYCRNLRWTSQKLLAASTERPVMGGRTWTSLGHDDPRVLHAALLWFNSTLGLIMHWSRGQRTHPGRAPTQINAVKSIPVPRFDFLGSQALDRADEVHGQLRLRTLRRLRNGHEDPVRIRIDEHVCEMLGLDSHLAEDLADWRRLFCQEPTVHGGRVE